MNLFTPRGLGDPNPGNGPELLQGLFQPEIVYLYLFLVALGLCCCAQVFSNCGKQGLPFVAVLRLLIAVASLVEEYRL